MGAHVILVEDDANVAYLVSRQLQRSGYEVRKAASLAEARNLVNDEPWDLAILDRRLPDGDGLDLCRDLRERSPHGYIIFLTGESSDSAKLEGFARGADDYITKPFQIDELLARLRAGERIVSLQKRLIDTNHRLEELSLTDAMTSLRNRRAFDHELSTAFERARRYDRPLSLTIVDVDHFKAINDSYGHPSGDAVLRGVAKRIAGCTRQSDFLARIGGEEFAILLIETPLFEAIQFGEKIRAAIAASPIRIGEIEHQVTISAGIANFPHSRVTTPSELFEAADNALYRAKERGRNRVEMERRSERRSEVCQVSR
jgi:two-component system cell cycle response regulator